MPLSGVAAHCVSLLLSPSVARRVRLPTTLCTPNGIRTRATAVKGRPRGPRTTLTIAESPGESRYGRLVAVGQFGAILVVALPQCCPTECRLTFQIAPFRRRSFLRSLNPSRYDARGDHRTEPPLDCSSRKREHPPLQRRRARLSLEDASSRAPAERNWNRVAGAQRLRSCFSQGLSLVGLIECGEQPSEFKDEASRSVGVQVAFVVRLEQSAQLIGASAGRSSVCRDVQHGVRP